MMCSQTVHFKKPFQLYTSFLWLLRLDYQHVQWLCRWNL